MVKKVLFIFYTIILNHVNSQVFKEPYYFVGSDEMYVFKQSHDTLYTSTTFSLRPYNTKKFKNHYKIWGVNKKPLDLLIVKLESLDSIPLTTDYYPNDRFRIFVFKVKNEKTLTMIGDINHLTKQKMMDYNTDSIQSKLNLGMDLHSLSYMKELLKLKKVNTKKDVDKINNELDNPKYLAFIENYKNENMLPDPYASILKANLINKACLNLGYSPIGASFLINIISSNKTDREKEQIINEFYKQMNP